jgi:Bifunctional DNA primase/polymerase, N-terminal
MTALDHALLWYDRGISPIPLIYRSKKPVVDWGIFRTTLPPRALLKAWFRGLRNIAIVLNHDYVILDFDIPDAYHCWFSQHPIKTYTVKSNRGYHVYLRVAESLDTSAMQGGEVLAAGHMATVPCSVHKSGHKYAAINDHQILCIDALADVGIIATPIEVQRTDQTYDGISHDYEARAWLPTGGFESSNESPISKIKRYASITKLLGFTSKNSTFVMRCPFHDDSTPSLQVWPADNKAFCHAPHCVAHRSIDVIDTAALLWKVDTKRAIGMLASQV